MRQRKRLTKQAFTAAAKRTAIGTKGLEIAQAVLVHGAKQKDQALKHDLTPQAVNRYISEVWLAHVSGAAEDLPPGLQRITVVLPEDKASIALEWEKQEKIRRLQDELT